MLKMSAGRSPLLFAALPVFDCWQSEEVMMQVRCPGCLWYSNLSRKGQNISGVYGDPLLEGMSAWTLLRVPVNKLSNKSKWQELQKWVLMLSGATRLPRWCIKQHLAAYCCAVWLPRCFDSLCVFVHCI